MVRIFLGWAALGLALSLVACGNITGLNGFTSSSGGGADASVRPDGSVGRDGSLGTTMPEASADAGPGEEASADGSDDSGEDSGDGAVEEGGCGSGALECDGGCVTPSIDPLNCGSCGNACPTAVTGSTPTCVQSVCSYECNPGLNVCGSSCVSLTTAANCGSCGAACTGTDVCASDGVYYGCATSCPPTEPTACSGACSDLTSDPLNCGSCGNVCTTAVANATPTCSGSSCSFTCDAGYNLCNGACIAYDTAQNCGACGVQCAPDGGAPACALSSGVYACVSGCPGSQVLCNGGCVDTTSNPSDCASCGHVCTTSVANATATCATSACSFSCNSGYSQCGGQCVNETTDRNNCGSCGAACPETMPYCVGSSCVSNCPASTPTLCSGSCVNTATNIANCGTCGNGCSTSVANATAGCVSSACTFTCNTGFALCNGACVNEQTSTTNCGGCGSSYACGSGQVCLGGACQNVCSASSQCPAGFACNTSTGQCTTTCSASQTCNGGCCSSGTCVNGESATACGGNGAACSSCTTSVANASAACPSNACSFVCNTNSTDCSGVCVAEQTDPNNCNGCGVVCPGVANGTATCASGACGFKCNSGSSACDGACINDRTDDKACGSWTHACVSPMTCKAGVCSHGCVVGGCDAAGGACTAAGQRCYCTANSECASGQCAEVTGGNDMSCSGCTTTSAGTDGFAFVLKSNVIPATPLPSFGYTPANFTPASYMGDLPSSATTISASCSYTSDKQSSAGTANGTYWTCGGTAPYVIPNVSQSGSGPKVDILVFSSLTLASGATLTLTGSNPVIFAVYGSVTISGTINASASGTTPGAGGDNGTYCGTGAAGANGN